MLGIRLKLGRRDAKSPTTLDGLPNLDQAGVAKDASKYNAPFPSNGGMLEDLAIEYRNVDHWEGDDETSNNSPEEKTVVPDGLEHRKDASVPLGHHVE